MSTSSRKKSQIVIASGLGVLGVGGLWFVSQILNTNDGGYVGRQTESGVTTTMIADRTRAAAPEMSWIKDASEEVATLRATVERLEANQKIIEQQAEQDRAAEAEAQDAILKGYEDTIARLTARLENGQGGLTGTPAATSGTTTGLDNLFTSASAPARTPNGGLGPLGPGGTPVQPGSSAQTQGQPQTQAPTTVQSDRFNPMSAPTSFEPIPFNRDFTLTPASDADEAEKDTPPNLTNYLPAGSYAPALVLSGVDASTAVTSQAEPVPVVFRITAPAVTAGVRSTNGRTIDLTGCTVTGSARGDLSSERVYVRLLKLSCVLPGNHVFERDVSGYMSGAGKAGARGLVVSREGPLVSNAAIAGALGGLASGISSVGSAGAESDQASFEDVLAGAGAASAAGGVSGAAQTLSDYYIERAEQYQPVVSLYGGTNVELVFLEGVDLG